MIRQPRSTGQMRSISIHILTGPWRSSAVQLLPLMEHLSGVGSGILCLHQTPVDEYRSIMVERTIRGQLHFPKLSDLQLLNYGR